MRGDGFITKHRQVSKHMNSLNYDCHCVRNKYELIKLLLIMAYLKKLLIANNNSLDINILIHMCRVEL